MVDLRQQIVRRLRLLLTVCVLALAWAPATGAADIVPHAHVVQIATTRVAAHAAIALAPVARRARPALALAQPWADTVTSSAPRAAVRSARGPSFDGRTLYLDLCTLLR